MIGLLSSCEKVLVLSCHTHTVNKVQHASNICEQDLGAACGSWWLGPRDPEGIPYATQQCGSPRNYFTVEFFGTDYALHWKGIGIDAGRQSDIWIKGENTEDNRNPALMRYDQGTVLVNIFGGGDMTAVRMRVDSLPWITPEKVAVISPVMERMKHRVGRQMPELLQYQEHYYLKTPSSHIWRGRLPDNLPEGVHTIHIEAEDRCGLKVSQTKIITTPADTAGRAK